MVMIMMMMMVITSRSERVANRQYRHGDDNDDDDYYFSFCCRTDIDTESLLRSHGEKRAKNQNVPRTPKSTLMEILSPRP